MKQTVPTLPHLFSSNNPKSARDFRLLCRSQQHKGPTAQIAGNFLQANLVVVPKQYAFDFLMFTLKNPRPCPLLEVVQSGWESKLAFGSDLRKDLPQYRVWQKGKIIEEPFDVSHIWSSSYVAFLLGCSFTFEDKLRKAGLISSKSSTVAMYKTKIKNISSGVFGGNLVVSMRMFDPKVVQDVIQVTEQLPLAHGDPIKIGWNGMNDLGIADLNSCDYGEAPKVEKNGSSIPLFWACGVTPQSAIEEANTLDEPIITHAPGCMFVTDIEI